MEINDTTIMLYNKRYDGRLHFPTSFMPFRSVTFQILNCSQLFKAEFCHTSIHLKNKITNSISNKGLQCPFIHCKILYMNKSKLISWFEGLLKK